MKKLKCNYKAFLLWGLAMSFLFNTTYAQTKSITGEVIDDTGQPLAGVTVLIEGTSKGTTTDFDGNFLISAEPSNKLIFSYIGMKTQTITVGNNTQLSVVLIESTQSLDEIVISVGYSSRKREEISSSVVNITADELSSSTANFINGVDLLQGKVAGLTILNNNYTAGEPPSVRIRGAGSITASSEPLWVVDGIISSATAFNPSDVASMTVLKDAGATGLYGSKAAGGVIVVTTKSGKTGKGKFSVNISNGLTSPFWGNFEGLMNSAQLYDYYREGFFNDNEYLAPNRQNTEAQWNNIFGNKSRDEVLSTDFDWLKALYPIGRTEKYNLSYSAGNENSKQYISLNYNKSDGTLRGNNQSQLSSAINLSNNISKKIKLDTRIFTSFDKINSPVIQENVRVAPFDSPYNEDGSIKNVQDVQDTWIGTRATNQLYHVAIGNELVDKKMSFIPNVILSYQITPDVKLVSNTRYSYTSTQSKNYIDGRSFANGNRADRGSLGEENAFLQRNQSTGKNFLNNAILTINKYFGSHAFDVLLGFEYQKNTADNFFARNTGLVNGISVLNATSGLTPVVGGTTSEILRTSYFSQLNYNFASKYFFTASYRRDGSSKFGSANRFGDFYSGSASWLISKEDFIRNSFESITNLKLRTSYGVTGNDNFPNFRALETFSLSGADYNGQSGALPLQLGNPDLTWEKATTINVGLDLGLWDKLDLTFEYYHIKNTDILYEVPVDPTSGFELAWQNIGDIVNKGLEFSASGHVIKNDSFKWYTNLSFATNRNEVVALTDAAEEGIIDGVLDKILKVGEDVNTTYVVDYVGADPATGLATWNTVDEDGNINGTTQWAQDPNIAYKTKNMTPKFTGGFSNKFTYKGVSLDFTLSYAGGFYTNVGNRIWFRTGERVIQGQSFAVLKDTWQQPGDQAYFPKPFYGVYGNNNTRPNKPEGINVVKGDFLKLNYITLAYDFPKDLLKALKLSNMNVFCRVDNPYLHVFDKNFTYTTPESGGFGGDIRVNNRLRPVIQSLIFGVNFGL